MIVEDTRQKADKHENKHDYWNAAGVDWLRSALPFADYWPTPRIAIDTKQDIQEIAMNMCGAGKEKKRFREECKKARDAGCKLVFLIEDSRYSGPEDLIGKKIFIHSGQILPGDQVAMAMRMHEERYGCEFRFCSPEDAGRLIVEILEQEGGG
jgi:ribosome-associated protein